MNAPSETDDPTPRCSRKDCHANARWVLVWNNPRIHTPDRRKTWLACDEHREYLGEFLGRRGFLRETVPFDSFTE
ncbi:hypothetical protein J4H86_04145 [Spiractinospora alimapuensis]|uniref:hypothetical protein n=1 Tax=Spiractinospora alimapuensis TaxID=2820884 RepID=UPI001F2FFB8D|nr:hypothetical protein [Spiractinospora alimapuensis]QVQ53006.1 hypothetical protein J4H86_04145 [Spiractinospora alimapuensis]